MVQKTVEMSEVDVVTALAAHITKAKIDLYLG